MLFTSAAELCEFKINLVYTTRANQGYASEVTAQQKRKLRKR